MVHQSHLKEFISNTGLSLYDLSYERPVLLVFLRHFGCIFCKEALHDLAQRKQIMEAKGIQIAFVHMTTEEIGQSYFDEFGLSEMPHFSDIECKYYQLFGLLKGNFKQLFGFQNWVKGFNLHVSGLVKASFQQIGDGFQMPGIFLLNKGKIEDSFIHKIAADKPNYEELISCCAS